MKKCLVKSLTSTKGHLDQQYMRTRFTTKKAKTKLPTILSEDEPIEPIAEPTNIVFRKIWETRRATRQYKISTDQTGRFPVKPNRGNQHVMVAYIYNDNKILVEPMKHRKENEIIRAYAVFHTRPETCGFKPKY